MDSFGSVRRDFLRMGSFGMAVLGLPALGVAAVGQGAPAVAGAAGMAGVFDVRRYGAAGDGKTVDTPAVNAAIDAAAAAGGGVVIFPAGTYVCFSIRLRSLVHLELMQGAVILAADSPLPGEQTGYRGGAYDAAEPKTAWDAYQDYGHNHWHNSLLWGEDLHDLSITGPGLIWGKGLSNGRGWVKEVVPFVAEQPGVGNKAIALKNCRNVLLRDFSILKGGHFGLLLTGVDNVTIDNLKIDTDRDGMDLDCCQNARVTNCTVNSPWDDGICPKSSYALGYARPTRNISITNCYVTGCYEIGTVLDGTFKKYEPGSSRIPQTGRIKCGTESNGGFINITISNCVFEGCSGYALETVDGALLEDITITNTTMRDLTSEPLFLRLGARLRGPKDKTKVGTLRRVLISNLDCYNAPMTACSVLSGIPGYAIEDVKLSNIYIHSAGGSTQAAAGPLPENIAKYPEPDMFGATPAHGFFLRHMRNVEMSHVEIATAAADARPAFYLDDVERADFFAVTAQRGRSGAFALHGVKDLRVGWSRAAADVSLPAADGKTL